MQSIAITGEPEMLYRFIAGGRTCRFCVIAMTLAIPACVGLRARRVGGLSSAALMGHRQPHSPSHRDTTGRKLIVCDIYWERRIIKPWIHGDIIFFSADEPEL